MCVWKPLESKALNVFMLVKLFEPLHEFDSVQIKLNWIESSWTELTFRNTPLSPRVSSKWEMKGLLRSPGICSAPLAPAKLHLLGPCSISAAGLFYNVRNVIKCKYPPPLFAQCFTHTLIVVGNSIASFCSVGMVLPKVYAHTHTHTLFWTSTKFNQKTILFFLLCLISPSTSQGLKQYGVFCCFVLFFT